MKSSHLTPELLRRYAAGTLTPAEQHAVERLLLGDPLAAEAAEGLARLRENGVDEKPAIADLRARLQNRAAKRQGRVVPLTWTRYAAAATVLLAVAGLGWWWLRTEPTATEPAMTASRPALEAAQPQPAAEPAPASAAPPEAAKAKTSPPPAKASSRNLSEPQPEVLAEEVAPAPVATAPPTADAMKGEAEASEIAAQRDQTAQKREAPPAAAPQAAPAMARRALTGPRFTGRVLGEDRQPVAGATVMSVTSNRGVATDALGRFFLPEFQPNDRLRIAAVGFQTVEITARDTVGTVTLQPDRTALAEVVVTRSGQTNSPAPEGGFSALDEFVRKNRRVAGRGRVMLSFRLGVEGRPERVRVQASDNPTLNAEAIRLLNEGPRWTQQKTTRRESRVGYEMKFD